MEVAVRSDDRVHGVVVLDVFHQDGWPEQGQQGACRYRGGQPGQWVAAQVSVLVADTLLQLDLATL